MRTLYAERRSVLLGALRKLPLEIYSPEAGIHCIGWLPQGMDERAVIGRAAAHALDLSPVSAFCIEPYPRNGLLLGYAAFNTQELRSGVRRLGALLNSVR